MPGPILGSFLSGKDVAARGLHQGSACFGPVADQSTTNSFILTPTPCQVLGHSKTVLVLLGGWAFLGDTITAQKLGGMALAVSGMVWWVAEL